MAGPLCSWAGVSQLGHAVAAEIGPRNAASSAGAGTTVKLPFLPLQLVCLVYSKAEPLHVPLTFFLIHFCVARIREGPRWLSPRKTLVASACVSFNL